ncbi:MAG: 50S ribosomal protein L30 [Candidatus Kapabacteria bacterium]|jgi:large subunit ribosomal protein L30|nr:50S ribosomal protein L30 [Candidatus Kapabacteria bacterium]
MSQLKITQIKSIIKTQEKQKLTIKALGLGHPNNIVIQPDNAQIRGMINVVRHLVHVEELTA